MEESAVHVDAGVRPSWRIEQNPVHVYPYDLVGGRYQPAVDAAEELIVEKPFDIRSRVRGIVP